MRVFAHRSGLAFSALVEALRRPHIHAVVIPSVGPFSHFSGMYRATRTVTETETDADVFIMSDRSGSTR
jgi:hypothetical protein